MSNDQDLYASKNLHWPTARFSNLDEKQQLAARAAARVQDGQTIGIGSGSSAYLVLWAIGDRVKSEKLNIKVVTSSYETEAAAGTLNIPTLPLGSVRPVWGVDGADEVDPERRLLKGRGGALFREKILWHTAQKMYLAVDASKYVERLGQGFALPIEVDRHAVELVSDALDQHGSRNHGLRIAAGKDGPVITESGNFIIDAWFDQIAQGLHAQLKLLPGVIETGLFEGFEYEIL
jgi:ribose 5-phosphate isomerase A